MTIRSIPEGTAPLFKLLDGQEDRIECGAVITAADPCQCSDPGCPHCAGRCTRDSESTLYRIDMEDLSGTPFCEPCAEDALSSGVFRTFDHDRFEHFDCDCVSEEQSFDGVAQQCLFHEE